MLERFGILGKFKVRFVDLLNLQFSRLTKPTGLTRLTKPTGLTRLTRLTNLTRLTRLTNLTRLNTF